MKKMKEDSILKSFGKNVQRARIAQNLTQEELAFKVNMHNTYIGMIERAERKISIVAAAKISRALDVSLDYLISEPNE